MGFCGTRDDALSVSKGVLQNVCFIDVLNLIPHAVLLLVTVFILIVWMKSYLGKLHVTTWVHFHGHSVRWILTLVLILVTAIEIGEGVISDSFDSDTVNMHVFIPQCLAFAGAIASIVYYHNVEQWNSPRFLLVLLAYWLVTATFKVFKAISLYKNSATYIHMRVWLTWIDVVLYFLLLLVELSVLKVQKYAFFKKSNPVQSPEELENENSKYVHKYVNFLSKYTFWWVTDILLKGFKNPLQLEDLGILPSEDQASCQQDILQKAFDEEKYNASLKNKEPSFHKTYLRAYWKILLGAGVLRLLGDLLAFVGPWCIEHIVDYAYIAQKKQNESLPTSIVYGVGNVSVNGSVVQDVPGSVDQVGEYIEIVGFLKNGYVLCIILFLTTLLQHSFLQNHYYIVIKQGLRLRTSIQAMVYRKSLRLSSLVLNDGQMTTGQIINHVSMDSMFMMYLFFFIHYLWAAPLQIMIALLMMYFKLGVSAVIGGSLVVIAAPINYYVGKGMSKMQKKVMAQADKRVKKCNEVIQGIKVIKLLAWELIFERSISQSRKEELKFMYYTCVYRVFLSFIGVAIPSIGTMITFVIYQYIENEPLTAGKALSTLSLFNIMTVPVYLITILITTLITAHVSCKRLVTFFTAMEVEGRGGKDDKTHSIGTETIDGIKMNTMVDFRNGRKPSTSLRKDEDTSSQSSLESTYSRTPIHSRRSSRASLIDVIDPKRSTINKTSSVAGLTLPDIGTEPIRRRHTSGVSTEDEDELADCAIIIEPRSIVEVSDASFSWDTKDKEICIKDINVKIPAGKLTVIVGSVGSGKSSLLLAILGEMLTVKGQVHWNKGTKTAYVSQRPWLLNSSLKDNILFGQHYSYRRYNKILQACALQPDIAQLPAGDMTEIGEKGINLSGGQKQRVSIARALYAKADTVIMDDPLSALDAHVGKHVFDEAIVKRLIRRKRTVVLVTHQLQYLTHANYIVVMKDGEIQCQGKLSDVRKMDPELYESWKRALRDAKTRLESSPSESKNPGETVEVLDVPVILPDTKAIESHHSRSASQVSQSLSIQSTHSHRRPSTQLSNMEEETSQEGREEDDLVNKDTKKQTESKGTLIKKEHRETGAVALGVYADYMKACGMVIAIVVLLLYVGYNGLLVSGNIILSVWAAASTEFALQQSTSNVTETFDSSQYMQLYCTLNMVGVAVSLLSGVGLYFTGIRASKILHNNLLDTLLHVPLRFFDTNPTGRIINRFSSDLSQIDQKLPNTLENLIRCVLLTVSALVVNTLGTVYFLFAAIPMVILYYCMQSFFRVTAREVQRLDNITKSPVFSSLSETLNGLQTIRAYKAEKQFNSQNLKAINANTCPMLYVHTLNRWLGIRLDYMGALLVFAASVSSLAACHSGSSTPALVGLSVTYALIVSFYLNWIVRNSTETEMIMSSVERVNEYTQLKREPVKHPQGNLVVEKSWPDKGVIEYRHVSLRYDESLENVVNNISCVISAGEKIGICGRTGSGKSSFVLSLFRMIDICEGQIIIDDKDIARLPLPDLRSRIAIIPQDPVIFTGTVRFNLDPESEITDDLIWDALETVQMKDFIKSLPDQLEASVTEDGDNFSVGQKQLFCLARAFLRDNKILVLDEATASIDLETDNKLQTIIATAFGSKTVITIAHRMSTILQYDRVMVLDSGHIAEFDVPQTLLNDTSSLFYSLVNNVKN